jgi:hypothetical protein
MRTEDPVSHPDPYQYVSHPGHCRKIFTIFTYQVRTLPHVQKLCNAGIKRLPDIVSETLKNKKIVLLEGAPQRYDRFSSPYNAAVLGQMILFLHAMYK